MEFVTLFNGQQGQILETNGDKCLFMDKKTGKKSWIKLNSIFTSYTDKIKASIKKRNNSLIEKENKRIKKISRYNS